MGFSLRLVAVSFLFGLAAVSGAVSSQGGGTSPQFVFSSEPTNDLYVAVARSSLVRIPRYATAAEAVAAAARGAGVLILADGYPDRATALSPEVFRLAGEKHLRLYVEYPSFLPGTPLGAPRDIKWERGVVSSGRFGPSLPRLRILALNGCRFLPAPAEHPDLVMARVAGFDEAGFGLPKETFPILFELPAGRAGSAAVLSRPPS